MIFRQKYVTEKHSGKLLNLFFKKKQKQKNKTKKNKQRKITKFLMDEDETVMSEDQLISEGF